jgi:hypothetical protein
MGAVRHDWSEPVEGVRHQSAGPPLTHTRGVGCLLVGLAASAEARPPIAVAAGDIACANSPCASQRRRLV